MSEEETRVRALVDQLPDGRTEINGTLIEMGGDHRPTDEEIRAFLMRHPDVLRDFIAREQRRRRM